MDNVEEVQRWLSESGIDKSPDNYKEATHSDLALFPGSRVPAALIFYHDVDGHPIIENGMTYRRLRMLNDAETRYLSMSGFGSHIYIPLTFKDVLSRSENDFIVITEGEKKADKGCLDGIPTIGLPGITMWFDDIQRERDRLEWEEAHPAGDNLPLTDKTPVHREIINLIEKFKIKKVVVLMDSDGYPMDFSALPIPMQSQVSSVHYLGRKCGVINREVWRQSGILAGALAQQVKKLKVYSTFCPPHVELQEVDKKRQVIRDNNAGKIIVKNGLDDWLVRDSKEKVLAYLKAFIKNNKAVVIADDKHKKSLGYIPVGVYQGSHLVVWNEQTLSLHRESIKTVTTPASIINMVGSVAAFRNWGKVHPETGEVAIKTVQALRDIEKECSDMGSWDADSGEVGAGVWEIDNNLVVNGKSEVCMITDTDVQPISRCELGRKVIYTSRPKAPDIYKEGLTQDDFYRLYGIVSSWNWRNKTETYLFIGWLLQQSFLGCLDIRPHMFITGQSGAGKSSLMDAAADFLADICFYVPDGSQTSSAGLKQKLKSDALTLVLDELEPGNGNSHEGKKRQEALISILRLLRAAYSISSSSGDKAERIGSIKGSVSGESVEYSTRTSVLMAGISMSDLEQADANRIIILNLNKIDPSAKMPNMDNISVIGRKARWTMWTHWTQFKSTLAIVHQYITTHFNIDQRLGWTLGIPIASLLTLMTSLDIKAGDEQMIAQVTHKIVEEYTGSSGVDVTPDHVKLMDKLLSLSIPVEMHVEEDGRMHVQRETMTIFEVIQQELGPGNDIVKDTSISGDFGRALHQRGMTARVLVGQNGLKYEIFISSKHSGMDSISRRLGVQQITGMLSRIEGATPAIARVDGGRQVRGVWVPINDFIVDLDYIGTIGAKVSTGDIYVTH